MPCDADRTEKTGVICCTEHYPEPTTAPQTKQRGRPKKDDGEVRELDVRLTPQDQRRPEFATYFTTDDFIKVIVAEEGGEQTDIKLHYHCYIETRRSDTWLYGLFARLTGGKGNKFYSLRKAHEGTKGYAVKDERICYYRGFTEHQIMEIIERSRNFRKETETGRKRESRAKEKYLGLVLKEVAEGVSTHPSPTPLLITEEILKCYSRDQKRFPPRATIENGVMSIYYKHNPREVVGWYAKNLVGQIIPLY